MLETEVLAFVIVMCEEDSYSTRIAPQNLGIFPVDKGMYNMICTIQCKCLRKDRICIYINVFTIHSKQIQADSDMKKPLPTCCP